VKQHRQTASAPPPQLPTSAAPPPPSPPPHCTTHTHTSSPHTHIITTHTHTHTTRTHSLIPHAHTHTHHVCLQGSIKPWQIIINSLPPWLRYREKFILELCLIPSKLKGQAAKKYYDFAARYEMNDLYQDGVDGVRVMMFGTSLDAPGRRELLEMTSCTSFFPCPLCVHNWQPGRTKPSYGGFRRFLPVDHPWRAQSFVFQGLRYNNNIDLELY
jgi:hypothetical protein